MRIRVVIGIALLAAMLCMPLPADAQDAKLAIQGGDTVKSVLERHVGQRVAVVLTTGPEIAGVVTTVGDKLVHLSQLTGREFSDAVVALDQISAVVIRVRGR
jgi:phage-related minor tail protein